MVWDFSALPGAGSKWRAVTNADRLRQARTARTLRRLAQNGSGSEWRSVQLRPISPPDEFTPAEEGELREFLERFGQVIRGHRARCITAGDELRIAWIYRAARADVPGAWTAWVSACRELSVQ